MTNSFLPGLDKKNAHDEKIGLLLVNLGTPQAPTKNKVRPYLKEFLWDPRVVEQPRWLWWLVLNGIILNTRPAKSAKAYQKVWRPDGSPLLVISRQLAQQIQSAFDGLLPGRIVAECAMRYGEPSVEKAMVRLAAQNARKILVLPLYPQYSATTTATVIDAVVDTIRRWRYMPEIQFVNDYFREGSYIEALAASVEEQWRSRQKPEKLVMSFHSIPRRYSDNGDPYFEQCLATAEALASRLSLAPGEWDVSFQSRLGTEEWLRPYTDETLAKLARNGVKRLDVICPGFAADCLETLEEIDQENRHLFLSSGGQDYHYIPALNNRLDHVQMFVELARKRIHGWLC